MENSASYLLLDEMLRHGQLQMTYSEFERFVNFLRREELITALERQALLEQAQGLNMDGEA